MILSMTMPSWAHAGINMIASKALVKYFKVFSLSSVLIHVVFQFFRQLHLSLVQDDVPDLTPHKLERRDVVRNLILVDLQKVERFGIARLIVGVAFQELD